MRFALRVPGVLGSAAILSLVTLLGPRTAGALALPKSESVLPTSGSWLERTFRMSMVNQPGFAPGNPYPASPTYEDTITGTVQSWVNSTTECVGAVFNPVSFGDDTATAQWKQAGFTTDPLSSQMEGICQDPGSGLASPPPLAKFPSNGMTPIDVSRLPKDPPRLVAMLVRRRTGLTSLDQTFEHPDGSSQGFERAALLLWAPRSGDSLGFRLALLHALAKLQGIHELGTVTTHSGVRGEAFAGGSGPNAETVVVSQRTGQLLELRNMETYPWALEWLGVTLTSFDPSPSAMANLFYPPISNEMHLTVQWIDVVTSAKVVCSTVPPTLRFLPSA